MITAFCTNSNMSVFNVEYNKIRYTDVQIFCLQRCITDLVRGRKTHGTGTHTLYFC